MDTASVSSMSSEKTSKNMSREVQHLVKAQRRIRGVIADVTPGSCCIDSSYGRFGFGARSVKANKNHPDRKPQVGDPCEFRLSHHAPPTAVSIRVAVPKVKAPETSLPSTDPSVAHCNKLLEDSCAYISPLIAKLDNASGLQRSMTTFYLLVKALDLIEASPESPSVKQLVLRSFYSSLDTRLVPCDLVNTNFFRSFQHVCKVYASLPDAHKRVVKSMTQKRGEALALWQTREVITMADNTEYLGMVGGTVSAGAAELVESVVKRTLDKKSAASMGIFIEKIAAIRSFLEHQDTGRSARWPKDAWSHHFDQLGQFAAPWERKRADDCLNTMVHDALGHAASAIDYLSCLIDSAGAFMFSAIPTVMALTLVSQLWDNTAALNNSITVHPSAAADILAIDEPKDAVWWLYKAVNDIQSRLTKSAEIYHPVTYRMLETTDCIRASLKRLEAAIALHGASTRKPENKSLTRALLAEQGAALGGKLLYTVIDSLNTVFQPSGPSGVELHHPYSFYPPSAQVSYVGKNGKAGPIDFLSGLARACMGLSPVHDGAAPVTVSSTQPDVQPQQAEPFSAFYGVDYEGMCVDADEPDCDEDDDDEADFIAANEAQSPHHALSSSASSLSSTSKSCFLDETRTRSTSLHPDDNVLTGLHSTYRSRTP
ncbi:Squalene synthase [Diplonema papillatum]|nr:Squalene synthase [Diplonema papillatum]